MERHITTQMVYCYIISTVIYIITLITIIIGGISDIMLDLYHQDIIDQCQGTSITKDQI